MRIRLIIVAAVLLFAFPVISIAQSEANPLKSFDWLIGSKWAATDGNYHVFERGIGGKSVVAKSYAMVGDEAKLVSEGVWFYHPGAKGIRGYVLAENMPFVLMEYETRFENGKMINKLKTFDKGGKASYYHSEWTPNEKQDGYSWTLFSGEGDKLKKLMTENYKKE